MGSGAGGQGGLLGCRVPQAVSRVPHQEGCDLAGRLESGVALEFGELWARAGEAMIADRTRVGRMLRAAEARTRRGEAAEGLVERAAAEIERSVRLRARRAASVPAVSYPAELPVSGRRDEILAAIRDHQVVVICGETGSGKTTQIPKMCLELGRGVAGMIGHTQPRRIAARTVAGRIADELEGAEGRRDEGTEYSPQRGKSGRGVVGYKVRFGDQTGEGTLIKVMTDGVLLAETQSDPRLERYDTIIIDEAHERSLNIDFLLGYLKQLLPRRPDLKVVITSATIDAERFARHFEEGEESGASREALDAGKGGGGGRDASPAVPVVNVSGRMYPVEVRWRARAEGEDEGQEEAILRAVDELSGLDPYGPGPKDILVFLTGEREIRETAEALRKHHPAGTEVLPLYSRLSAAEQMRVFQPHGGRRIVLATNVAETSLTVPGVRYVIDPGFARVSRYSHRNKVQRLPIEPISQASADQRKGRCGRLAEGVCIRLYAEEDYAARPRYTEPEILRTNLASVILQMKALKLGRVEEFPFLEPPDGRMIRDGYETLAELGAIDEEGRITKLGLEMARLPIDPRLGRMILQAGREGAMEELLVIGAALSIQDPRERPMAAAELADLAHDQFRDESSDFLGLLKLWREFHERQEHLSGSRLRKWCRDNFLSYVRMREWVDIYQQLHGVAGDMGLAHHQRRGERKEASYEAIHRSVLAGLLSNVGMRRDTPEYSAPRAGKFHIFPGSGLFRKRPRWVVAAEVVQTTKLYARTVAKIEPEWIEELAGHLVKRSYQDPHWSMEAGQVAAFERVMLWGLEVVPRRRVHYGPINPKESRAILIGALAEGGSDAAKWQMAAGQTREPGLVTRLMEHNRRVIEEARRLEAKVRKPDLLVESRVIFDFYDARLPADVYSVATLEKWLREAARRDPGVLRMRPEDLIAGVPEGVTQERYPDRVAVGAATRLNLDYRLDPGGTSDGITMEAPIEALMLVDEERAEWLVPGMLREKILALFKTLPKAHRKLLEPMPALAERLAVELEFGRGSLVEVLSARIEAARGVKVPRDAWKPKGVPDHLRMNVRVYEERGGSDAGAAGGAAAGDRKVLAEGRDIAELKSRLAGRAQKSFARATRTGFDRDGITAWDFGDLPERMDFSRDGLVLSGHPALVDAGQSVSLRMMDKPDMAAGAMRGGLRRLFLIQARDEIGYHLRLLPNLEAMALHYASLGGAESLRGELSGLVAERVFMAGAGSGGVSASALPRTKAEFEARLSAEWKRIGPVMRESGDLIGKILAARHAVALRIADKPPPAWEPVIADLKDQLVRLLPKGFIGSTPWAQLQQFPRYLAAVQMRLEKVRGAGLARDLKLMSELLPLWRRYTERAGAERPGEAEDPELMRYRWMLEELRVSMFAQELGTAQPVSVKRAMEQWGKVR
jgi:ATP-dependent helicase HrpA